MIDISDLDKRTRAMVDLLKSKFLLHNVTDYNKKQAKRLIKICNDAQDYNNVYILEEALNNVK